ncbi:hypothetical protein SLEP1_g14294 [Rubroshorea leprosula]|uniref:Uncharacterized protein n=1 Tax=Rubroshorea leprosula TaxID=152421 RepID=A0AAV5III8_9ROSI|nr:hypothetical protein SLEP1_g14294 [Rubroshorea leprosula]
MSSEDTMSVVGSKVMPLEYESMDTESSSSPTSSEKTVEGVRGDEVVEVRGNEMVGVERDSVPIIVVEVEGRGERGYEIDADIVEKVKQYRSELGTRDSLGHLVENYEISSRVLVRPAGVEERACSAPRDHWMPVYAHYLLAELRFPIPELLVGLLLDYSIGLTQLVPNAMRYGSMDTESSPSPTSSEKTVEGVRGDEVVEVRGNEMVGVKGDSVPITVVEVEGRGERGYEIDADIVEKVKQYRSELGTRDSLGHLVENYEISSRVLVRPARVEERACSAPRDHWMPVYAHYLLAELRFPIPELLVGLLLDYSIGLTQLVPNAMRGGSRKDKGWYYFTPRVANRESRALFTVGPSSIKGWKGNFFFVDDTEWERGDNEGGDLLNIMDLTSAPCIEVAELYGSSVLSEGVAIPKKPRKKSKTSTKQVDEGRDGKEVMPTTSTEAEEEVPQLKRKGWEERRALQKKKKVVEEEEERGSEVPQFVPQPPLVELDLELRQLEEGAEVRAPGKGNGPVPSLVFQSSLFEAKNMMGARRFINTTFPEVDKRNTRDEALSASWVNGLAQEFMDSVLNELVPTVKQLEQERASLSTKLVFEESKRRISESERETQVKEIVLMKDAFMKLKENVQMLVHNGMKEHISSFISSSSFDNIVNLYRLPTAIIAFADCKKKVKAEYPKVDITKITFGKQEEGVEENGESISADFRPQIKLRWEHDADGRAVFPPQFDFKFVVMEEEGAEVEEDEVEAGVEGTEVGESQRVPEVEIHLVPFDNEQLPLPDEQQPTQPPLPTEQEPMDPPPPVEK